MSAQRGAPVQYGYIPDRSFEQQHPSRGNFAEVEHMMDTVMDDIDQLLGAGPQPNTNKISPSYQTQQSNAETPKRHVTQVTIPARNPEMSQYNPQPVAHPFYQGDKPRYQVAQQQQPQRQMQHQQSFEEKYQPRPVAHPFYQGERPRYQVAQQQPRQQNPSAFEDRYKPKPVAHPFYQGETARYQVPQHQQEPIPQPAVAHHAGPSTPQSNYTRQPSLQHQTSLDRQQSYQSQPSYEQPSPQVVSATQVKLTPSNPPSSQFQQTQPKMPTYHHTDDLSSPHSSGTNQGSAKPFAQNFSGAPKPFTPGQPHAYGTPSHPGHSTSSQQYTPTPYQASSQPSYPQHSSYQPQSYQPSTPQSYHPTTPQSYQPTTPQAYQPPTPQTYQPSTPQAYQPSTPQNYQPSSPQAYQPQEYQQQMYQPTSYTASTPTSYQNGQPNFARQSSQGWEPQSDGMMSQPPPAAAPPPPPPPPPGQIPSKNWRRDSAEESGLSGGRKPYDPSQESGKEGQGKPFAYIQPGQLPDVLQRTASNQPTKKPFTYTPGGLDLSHVNRSPGRVRRGQDNMPVMSPSQRILAKSTGSAPVGPSGMAPRNRSPSPRRRPAVTIPPPAVQNQPMQSGSYTPGGTPCSPGPGMATVKHAQFNSPLNLYSADNVEEAFVGQTQGVVTGVHGLKKDKPQLDISKSKTLKMLQEMESKPNRPTYQPMQYQPQPVIQPEPQPQQETPRYMGHTDPNIQSKSFKLLQMMTDQAGEKEIDDDERMKQERLMRKQQEEEDEKSFSGLRKNPSLSMRILEESLPPESEQQNYVQQQEPEEKDVRYKGATIPSRSFKLLQEMTGGPAETDTVTPAHPKQEEPPTPEHPHGPPSELPREAEPRKYSGAAIPSRAFKFLQEITSDEHIANEQQQQHQQQQQQQQSQHQVPPTQHVAQVQQTPAQQQSATPQQQAAPQQTVQQQQSAPPQAVQQQPVQQQQTVQQSATAAIEEKESSEYETDSEEA